MKNKSDIRSNENLEPDSLFSSCKSLNFYETSEINNGCSVNFVLNDYLALSSDERIKCGKVRAIRDGLKNNYSFELMYRKAEEYMSWIFDKPVLLFPNSAIVHKEVIPVLINTNDAIILDNHVHSSLRIAADLFKRSGKYIETIEHNNIHNLEARISELSSKYSRIWYLADSIYSTPGDVFPIDQIQRLLNKYDQFYVYIDDSKGMSWIGENGEGYIHANLHHHPKVILSASLSKGFGSEGGVLVCHDEKMKKQISKDVNSFRHESLLEPAILASIVESAKIHLSNEIYSKQTELRERIALFNSTSLELGLPVISSQETPVAFFVMGKPDMSQEICFNLLRQGYYINMANFPMVPYHCSGIMVNVTLHQSKNNIKDMLNIFSEEYDKALKKRNLVTYDILQTYKAHELMS